MKTVFFEKHSCNYYTKNIIFVFLTFFSFSTAYSIGPPDRFKNKKKVNPDGYVHSWKKFPTLVGRTVFTEELVKYKNEKGYSNVVIFISSWCVSCQNLIEKIRKIEEKYIKMDVNFIYVLAHETKKEAQKFAEHYSLKNAIFANNGILKFFHNPPLPTLYMADRHGWMALRRVKFDEKDLQELDDFLNIHTLL